MSHLPFAEEAVLHFIGARSWDKNTGWLMQIDCKLDSWTLSSWLNSAGCRLLAAPPGRKAAEQSRRGEDEQKNCVPGGEGRGRKREADTSPVSNQRSCGARFKAGMGQISKSPGVLPPFASSSHFPRRKEEEKQKKKKRVKWRGGKGWGGGEEKGGRRARHTAVFGLEGSSGKHVTNFFFYACTSPHLGFLGYYCAITTSHFSELFKIHVTSFPSTKKNQSEL